MFQNRTWFRKAWNRPKYRLSLDHLKYLYTVLEKNNMVSENNRGLLVESLRCIAEILIWGDQHDSLVFDFFLEKNMLSFFLHIMRQKSGGSNYVCVQLLQTLNILFENIRNETSLYYLLSNNHVNSIIVHKFDFSDEDVMGYYILFLKTLSFKLNAHTIHFFYNEHTNDFPLYTEAIKFFNHPESMVRIAVRTISLNVYRIQNTSMQQFIREKTADPYFSNLVSFIGKHIMELDRCVRTDINHQSNQKLSNLVAEHLDHLHYLNDILLLEIGDLNIVLTEHLLRKLFVPLYIFSLTPAPPISMALITKNLASVLNKVVDIDIPEMNNPRVSSIVAFYLLSLVFLVFTHGPLVHALAWIILNTDNKVFTEGAEEILSAYVDREEEAMLLRFKEARERLEESFDAVGSTSFNVFVKENFAAANGEGSNLNIDADNFSRNKNSLQKSNITDEQKEKLKNLARSPSSELLRPLLDIVLLSLDCVENDYMALISLCLIYAMANNQGVSKDWLDQTGNSSYSSKTQLLECLLNIISASNKPCCHIRLITLEITLDLLVSITKPNTKECCITEFQKNKLFLAKCQAINLLRHFYKSEDMFLDLFENEYNEMKNETLNVEYLCMDSNILLPPTGTPLTGIGFTRRLPCGEVEKARRAIRGFFLLRRTCQIVLNEIETILPLANSINCIQVDNVLDLNNSDLIACTVISKDSAKQKRFLVIDNLQLILVEPDAKLLGWGVAKFVGFLQNVEVVGDKDDSRCLHISVHRGGASNNRTPLLSAKFLFDDHIRCMAAKQRLTKGRSKARQRKMYQIGQLLEVQCQFVDSSVYTWSGLRCSATATSKTQHWQIFSNAERAPGLAAAIIRDNIPTADVNKTQIVHYNPTKGICNERNLHHKCRGSNINSESITEWDHLFSKSIGPKSNWQANGNSKNLSPRSLEGSPRFSRPRCEEIPLEDFKHSRNESRHLQSSSNVLSRPDTSSSSKFETLPCMVSKNLTDASFLIKSTKAAILDSAKETSFISQEDKKQQKGLIKMV